LRGLEGRRCRKRVRLSRLSFGFRLTEPLAQA
jgi:hypothetical protein